MSAPTLTERTQREQRSIERDRGAIRIWHREVAEDLIGSPTDPELLAEEEVVALLLDRVERGRGSTATASRASSGQLLTKSRTARCLADFSR